MGFVVELVIRVHDSAQVDATHFLCAAFSLQILQQAVNDATHTALVLQVINILCKSVRGSVITTHAVLMSLKVEICLYSP